jgi:hypothetical protein
MNVACPTTVTPRWSWIGACSTGTSHLQIGSGCDDSAACLEIPARSGGNVLIAVVSDGAGSASLSRLGSRIVTQEFCRSAIRYFRRGGHAADIDTEIAGNWLDDIRDSIDFRAKRLSASPKAFAATLVAAVVQSHATTILHVGDGACALRISGQSEWQVPSWPAQGEYASTTYFVTDDPQPRVTVSTLPVSVEEIAVFTDGLERLALDFSMGVAFHRFFETMFPALRNTAFEGRQRALSRDLRAFLDSASVTDRTDDDKSLIMARLTPGGIRLASRDY